MGGVSRDICFTGLEGVDENDFWRRAGKGAKLELKLIERMKTSR